MENMLDLDTPIKRLVLRMSITFGLAMFFGGLFYGFWFHKVMQEKYEEQEKQINE